MITRVSRAVVSAVLLTGTLALAACEAPDRAADYRENHPIQVKKEEVRVVLSGQGQQNLLSQADRLLFQRFIREYHLRGKGAVIIRQSGQIAGEGERLTRLQHIRELLHGAGVSAGEINVLPAGANGQPGRAIELSFRTTGVDVPECGDWSTNPTFNWSNRSQANYGCAVQRNLGLTVADPNDLKTSTPMSNAGAGRSLPAVRNIQSGNPATGGGGGGGGAAAAGGAAAP